MSPRAGRVPVSSRSLRKGDQIHALIGDVIHFQGRVVDIHPTLNLFWAVDRLGDRRLIELCLYAVFRIKQPAHQTGDVASLSHFSGPGGASTSHAASVAAPGTNAITLTWSTRTQTRQITLGPGRTPGVSAGQT